MSQLKRHLLITFVFFACFTGCGEEPDDFDETVIVAARLDNIELSWKGAAYGDISGNADLVVTDLRGEELTKPVSLFGGVFGAVGGGVEAENIFSDEETFKADFSIPDLPDDLDLTLEEEVALPDGGIEIQERSGFEDAVGEVADLIKAEELFGAYFGGQMGFAVVAGWDAQFLIKSPEITLVLSHPTFGFGLAMGVEWLSIVK